MKIAVEGCAHGELDIIYETIKHIESQQNIKIDLLICCGDFQATRNVQDLRCMAVPLKFQNMCSFYKYYSGEKIAPVLTIFIGGNHEASNYLQELPYGGWVAPNIYYMGYAGVVNVAGIRIGGLSGIYKGHDYMKGHFEKPPYSDETKRSCYHIRNLEVFRLKQLKEPIDIFLSHDWPRGIYHHGNIQQLLKVKPFFQDDINKDCLGSKPCEELLRHLTPKYWFAAHLHVKFAATVKHLSDFSGNDLKTTKFLALDKCLPKRKFLQILDISHDSGKPIELNYDLEWLTVLHITNHLLSVQKRIVYMPGPGHDGRWNFTPTKDELELVRLKFENNLTVPKNFTRTVPAYNPRDSYNSPKPYQQLQAQINPQTMVFCDRLGVDDPMSLLLNCYSELGSLNSSEVSSCSLPSFLTPQHSRDNTQVSFDQEDSEATVHTELTNRYKNVMESPRLSLVLPSPLCSNTDKHCVLFSSDFNDEGKSKSATPNSQSSDTEELINSSNEEISDSQPNTDGEVGICETQPKMKIFKRRNQSLYTSMEDS